MTQKRLLFVCLGNICRSPSAEAVMKKLAQQRGIEDKYVIDSAGIIGHHEGEPADPRMQKHAEKRGVQLESLARQVRESDFDQFDLLFAMDQRNFLDLHELAPGEQQKKKIRRMCDFTRSSQFSGHQEVPDPYFGGSEGFELVLDLLEDACSGLLEELENQGPTRER